MEEKERETIIATYHLVLKKIAEKRKKAGFIQYDVAEHLDLSESGYFKIESGRTKLDFIRFLEILDKLEITPEEFFKGFK